MKQMDIKKLLEKYISGQCSAEEIALLETWYLEQSQKRTTLSAEEVEDAEATTWRDLEQYIKRKQSIKRLPLRIAAAAAIVIVFFAGIIYVHNKLGEIDRKAINARNSNDIKPGRNAAALTLANGKIINLSNAKSGVVIEANKVTYNDGTVIENNNYGTPAGVQTISTPKGGQYQIILPDNTKVWLNAVSHLKFPATFNNAAQRKVELTGEAYFEVKKDSLHPFIVISNNQTVEVLGTHFNVNTYANEEGTKTTLLEGSVKITRKSTDHKSSVTLKPGEQAIDSGSGLIIKDVDIDLEIAWKNGKTEFQDADLKTVMGMLERWYNIEVKYKGKLTDSRFTGSVSRNKNISEVLELLETTGDIHFKIEGRSVVAIMN